MESGEAKEILEVLNNRETADKSLYGFPVREKDARRSSERKRYDIKGLWSRHKEIINLDSLGYKGTEIAKMLGIHPVTVSMTLNSTLGSEAKLTIRDERDEEYSQLREEVMDLTRISLDKYREILTREDASYKLQIDVANTVTLDLAGMRAPTKIQSTSMVLGKEEIAEFKKRGIEAAKLSGHLIEVSSESSESTE